MLNKNGLFFGLVLLSLSACATGSRSSHNVNQDVQMGIGSDMFSVLAKTFYANKTPLRIKSENASERVVADLARRAGFAVSEEVGDHVKIKVYYQADTSAYIATMTVGELRRFTKTYREHPEGLKQTGFLSVGG